MVHFIPVSQVTLRAVLGNIVRTLSMEFVRGYGVHRLVFVEFYETMADAILREKRIKNWRRAWKLELIERHNPQWRDLYDKLS
jgi:putative endonuclease